MMRTILVGLGSNHCGKKMLALAVVELRNVFGDVKCSPFEETQPLQGSGPAYVNAVALFKSELQPAEIKQSLKAIEAKLGRDRSTPNVVAIDLDLLLCGDVVDANLKLPSKDLIERTFCLLPAAKLAPNLIHPVLKCTLNKIAEEL